jgi:hypothetical protein
MAWEIKRGDRRPYWQGTLKANGDPVDLTDATSASFIMKLGTTGTPKVNKGAMTFVDRPNGVVRYAWAAGDTDTSGDYNVEVEVSWSGELQTFPSKGYFVVTISDDLA